MATRPLLADEDLCPEAAEVFADIRAVRGTDYVNNFWRALAHDPENMGAVWERLKQVMGPGALDPLMKELIYIAVSTANGCEYCVHSHTASAKAKGMSPEMHAELLAVIGMASQTNALATALQVETDEVFRV
jgi:AhpD family alkylhydroperoxidase